ncbi:MAG: tRNA (N(6)-L-threonylcarbamoyladenosine(37)-C(2))-methylthiotransferase MtaB [Candidatus Heteroscillospira sp.]|jgi:threonylcarbamoyladenosine tRNA methylthiotransferase MtaB
MKFAVHTLGCKVNQYETQAIETLLRERGHSSAGEGERADVIIINTCAVTAESGRKSRQAIRRMQHDHPGAVTAVCGCFSQLSPEQVKELGADIVYGSGDKLRFVEDLEKCLDMHDGVMCIDNPFRRVEFEELPAGAADGRTRAMLKIQDGCANFCTYCVIPYTRGRVRSLPVSAAVSRAMSLQAGGFAELVLTGIEIASYGKDLREGENLCSLVCAIGRAAPGLRLRLGSLEPTVITEDFCRSLAELGNVCRHFHLSLQSGCDATLKAMNRKYDTAQFYEKVELLRRYFPGCGLTADLIAGFPGETEEHHRATLKFIEKCGFSAMHIFPYSSRPGTKAADMPGQLSRGEKAERAAQAQAVADAMQAAFLDGQQGRTLPVLFETGENGVFRGHSDNYCEVEAEGSALHGRVRDVFITGRRGQILTGNLV